MASKQGEHENSISELLLRTRIALSSLSTLCQAMLASTQAPVVGKEGRREGMKGAKEMDEGEKKGEKKKFEKDVDVDALVPQRTAAVLSSRGHQDVSFPVINSERGTVNKIQ